MTSRGCRACGIASSLVVVALVKWGHTSGVLETGCESWEAKNCGIFLHCPLCIRTLQNLYWVVRAWSPLYPMLVLLAIALAVIVRRCPLTLEGEPRAKFSRTQRQRWMALGLFLAVVSLINMNVSLNSLNRSKKREPTQLVSKAYALARARIHAHTHTHIRAHAYTHTHTYSLSLTHTHEHTQR